MIEPRIVLPFVIPMSAIAGVVLGNEALLFLAGALFFLLVFAWLLGNESMRRIAHTRASHGQAFEKKKVEVHLSLRNRGNVPLHSVQLTDYFLAQDMMPKRIITGIDLPARKTVKLAYHPLCLRHRGQYKAGPLEIQFSDPLGFFSRKRVFPQQESWTVLPPPLQLQRIMKFSFTEMGTYR